MPIDGAVGVALADGAGAGGFGGDTGSTGDDGAGADTGSTGDESGIGDGLGTGDDGAGGEPEYEIDETTGEPKVDAEGNKVPKVVDAAKSKPNFKATYDKIKEADPIAAEAYRKAHFGYQKYQEIFPTTADATAAKEALETYGGTEGIEALNTQAQQFASEMEQFSQGNPQFLSQLAKDDPEGFAKSAAASIKILGESNPQAYSSALVPILHSTLESSGINASIVEAGNLISDVFKVLKDSGNTTGLFELQKAFDALKKSYDYSQKIKQLADESGEKPLTEREKQLQTKEQQLTEKEQTQYYKSVQTTVTKTMDSLINTSLSAYYKQFPKITKDQRADLHSGVFSYISQQLSSNKKYQTQLRALLNDGDVDKVNNFISQNVKKIAQTSAKTIWNRRGFGALPNQKAPSGQGDKNASVTLTRKPKHDDVDWSKTTELEFMGGSATLKGSGRKVKWNWEQQQ